MYGSSFSKGGRLGIDLSGSYSCLVSNQCFTSLCQAISSKVLSNGTTTDDVQVLTNGLGLLVAGSAGVVDLGYQCSANTTLVSQPYITDYNFTQNGTSPLLRDPINVSSFNLGLGFPILGIPMPTYISTLNVGGVPATQFGLRLVAPLRFAIGPQAVAPIGTL